MANIVRKQYLTLVQHLINWVGIGLGEVWNIWYIRVTTFDNTRLPVGCTSCCFNKIEVGQTAINIELRLNANCLDLLEIYGDVTMT